MNKNIDVDKKLQNASAKKYSIRKRKMDAFKNNIEEDRNI